MTKPVPPDDLWDFLTEEAKVYSPPAGAFTIMDYARKFELTQSSAESRLTTLERDGKIKFVGRFGNKGARYYVRAK